MRFSAKQKANAIRAIDAGKELLTAIKEVVREIAPDGGTETTSKAPIRDELAVCAAKAYLRPAGIREREK